MFLDPIQKALELIQQSLQQVIANQNRDYQLQQEIHKEMGTVNSTISSTAGDVKKLSTDFATYVQAVQAYINSTKQPTGTVLSADDQAALNTLDQQTQAMDTAIQAFQVPPVTGDGGTPTS